MNTESPSQFSDALAHAYCEIAATDTNMREAANALESIREAVAADSQGIGTLGKFDEQVGTAEEQHLLPLLIKLRTAYESSVFAKGIKRIREAQAHDPTAGWNRWLEAYVESLTEPTGRSKYCYLLAQEGLIASPVTDWPLERVRASARAVYYERWPQTYDWLFFLSNQPISSARQARICVMLGQIQLYYFGHPSKARSFLKQAQNLKGEDYQVLSGWGSFYLEKNDLESAKKYADELLQKFPDLNSGYSLTGDYYAALGNLPTAEDFYKRAILIGPGSTDGYSKLLNLYGRSEWYADHKSLLPAIHKRLYSVGENPCIPWVSLGVVHKQNEAFEQAQGCFEQVISIDGTHDNAFVWLGYTFLDKREFDQAQGNFEKAIELQPKALDGYWAMSLLFMYKKEWENALNWCDRCFETHPEWESLVRGRRMFILRQLGRLRDTAHEAKLERLKDAEHEALLSLQIEANNPAVLNDLVNLSNEFDQAGDREAAMRVLDLLQYGGDKYMFTFHSEAGNLSYYDRKYENAAEHYRKAIALNSSSDVVFSNLAKTLLRMQTPGKRLEELEEAIKALQAASELTPSSNDFKDQLANHEKERDFLRAYGENALKYSLYVTPIRIEVHSDFLDYISEKDGDPPILSRSVRNEIRKMRRDLAAELFGPIGIDAEVIPMVQILPFQSDATAQSKYRIDIMERVKFEGQWTDQNSEKVFFESDSVQIGVEHILESLKHVLLENLTDFVGHHEVASLLETAEVESGFDIAEAKKISSSFDELTEFVRVVRILLGRQIPLVQFETVCIEFNRMRAIEMDAGSIANSIVTQLGLRNMEGISEM